MIRVPGYGNGNAKLMVVGEAPGMEEEMAQRPFVGMTGQIVRSTLKDNGIDPENDVYYSNVLKYRPPDNIFRLHHRAGIDYEANVAELWKEVKEVAPNCILALGNEALKALTHHTGIKKYRGSILQAVNTNTKVVPSIHPSAFMRSGDKGALPYSTRDYCALDYAKAIGQSLYSDLRLPSRTLEIARDSLKLFQFFRRYEDKEICSVDIEVIACIPTCIAFAFNKHHAISVPLLPHIFPNLRIQEFIEMWRMCDETLRRVKICGQNFKFDEIKILTALGMRFRNIDWSNLENTNNMWWETSLQAHTLYPEFPRSQEFLASIWTDEPYYKDEYREFDSRRDSYERVLSYNAKDAAVAYEIGEEQDKEIKDRGFEDYYYNFIRHLHPLYVEIEQQGMLVDYAARKEMRKKYTEQWATKQLKLDEFAGRKVNVSSTPQVKKFCEELLELPKRAKYDEDTIVALISNVCNKTDKHRWKGDALNLILDIRKIRKTLSTYLKARPDFDGRMRCSWKILGTETGRSSTKKHKAPERPVQSGIAFQTLTKHGTVGTDLRRIFIPDPGCVFFQFDLSQAEARIVAVLSEDWELLDKFNSGLDVHSELSSAINGKQWDGKRASEDQRFLGKTGRHSFNYGVKKDRFALTVNTDAKKFGINLEISSWKANEILKMIRLKHPKTETVFQAGVEQALRETRTLRTPNGWERQFRDRMTDQLFSEGFAHIPQNTVRFKTANIMLAVKKEYPWVKFCIESHDAGVSGNIPEAKVDEIGRFVKEQARIPINFSRCTLSRDYNLVIPADIEVGYNYKDLEKRKILA
jgi:uracil-DNA glycosylase family 4